MKVIIVIPARYGSTRLPGKPLSVIAGKPMVQRVWELAKHTKHVDSVLVATDDSRIVTAVDEFGGTAVMTDESISNGTMRVLAAVRDLKLDDEDVIINLQGDAPVTPPWVIQELVDGMRLHLHWQIGTPAVQLTWDALHAFKEAKQTTPFSGTCVVFNRDQKALYFSKNIIPALRKVDEKAEKSPVYRHIGLYAYRYGALKNYATLQASPLEELEGLEQLRALENDIPIHVVTVDYKGRSHESVDSPEDIERVEAVIREHGELV